MRICHCHAVSDREIRAAAQCGATTVGQVARVCRAGGTCGGCVPAIREIIEQTSLVNFTLAASTPTAAE